MADSKRSSVDQTIIRWNHGAPIGAEGIEELVAEVERLRELFRAADDANEAEVARLEQRVQGLEETLANKERQIQELDRLVSGFCKIAGEPVPVDALAALDKARCVK